jgi:hypothetical protein
MKNLENYLEISVHVEWCECGEISCSENKPVVVINDNKLYPESHRKEDVLKSILEYLGYKPEITWML